MPTGYTAGVADGTITTFKDYAYQCARAFGALVTERDNPITPDLPVLEVGDYYRTSVEKAEQDLKRFLRMSSTRAEIEFLKEKIRDIKYHSKAIKDDGKTRKRYMKMIAECEKFEAPTEEHINYRNFLISQLKESLEWDCSRDYHHERLLKARKRQSPTKWLCRKIKEAREHLARTKESLKEEIERVNSRNQWISQLREAVSKV